MVGVARAGGYVGGEAPRSSSAYSDVRIGALTEATSVGLTLPEPHPHLLASADSVVFQALPHGRSAQVTDSLQSEVLVVDPDATTGWSTRPPGQSAFPPGRPAPGQPLAGAWSARS